MKKPLAFRMRPDSIDEVIGQLHIVGPHTIIRKSVENKTPISIIFYGPPGAGKTTIAISYGKSLGIHCILLNAVTSNKKDLERAIEESKLFKPSFIIMDEVHRLNKDKQDILLPFIEDGTIYLLGATTANPYMAINSAVRSRTLLVEVKPLTTKDIVQGLKRAITSAKGLKDQVIVSDEALLYIAKASGGDMRFALNYLEIVSLTDESKIGLKDVKTVLNVSNVFGDKAEEEHYDTVSAFQKSIRGSDVDAALLYLAKLCESGDLDSIERRLLVTAYEDIGLANPQAVDRTHNAIKAAHLVGFPEAIIPLGFSVVELALSPKSKASANSIAATMSFIQENPTHVLEYLRYTPVNVDEEDKYPYDRPDLWENMQYLPDKVKETKFYTPWYGSKYEAAINENYARLLKKGRSSNLRKLKQKN